jgi:hypothetical protein
MFPRRGCNGCLGKFVQFVVTNLAIIHIRK